MSVLGSALVKELLQDCKYMHDFRILRTSSLPNEIITVYEVVIANSQTNQSVIFTVWVSEFDEVVLGYKIVDYLGNVLNNLNDDILKPYFYDLDSRQYMADLGRVALRFGRSKWMV
jgi:hypothetical protein